MGKRTANKKKRENRKPKARARGQVMSFRCDNGLRTLVEKAAVDADISVNIWLRHAAREKLERDA